MTINKFEDILGWQKSRIFVSEIYKLFSQCRDFSFKDQMFRATVSIMNNIAEGYERMTNKDFKNFLYIAKGSCAEVRSMLYLSLDLKYISQESFDYLYQQVKEISKILSGFIKKL